MGNRIIDGIKELKGEQDKFLESQALLIPLPAEQLTPYLIFRIFRFFQRQSLGFFDILDILGYPGVMKVENSSLWYCYKDKAGKGTAETVERG